MTKAVLKLTDSKAAFKLYGTTLNETITLAVDCLPSNQALTAGGTPRANIVSVFWTGTVGGTAIITRGGVVIMNISADTAGSFMFVDQEFTDNIGNSSDIVVTGTGTMQVYLVLRKVTGWSNKIETAEYSVYDNTTAVGS